MGWNGIGELLNMIEEYRLGEYLSIKPTSEDEHNRGERKCTQIHERRLLDEFDIERADCFHSRVPYVKAISASKSLTLLVSPSKLCKNGKNLNSVPHTL